MQKITHGFKLIKIVLAVLIIFNMLLSITQGVYAGDVEPGESLTGKGQVPHNTYILDGRPVYVYGTASEGVGGYITRTETGTEGTWYDYHIYKAEPKSGWRFVKWVTYYSISDNSFGQNSKIGTSSRWFFSTPSSNTTEANTSSQSIRVNNGADIMDYTDYYKLYAVFAPIVTGTVDGHGEISTYSTYTEPMNKIELPVSYQNDSENIYIDNKYEGYEIDTITINGQKLEITDGQRDYYRYQFKSVTSPQTINATFRPVVYKIKFDGNGNTSGTMNKQEFSYWTAENLIKNSFKKTGYEFNGWNTSADGTGANYTDEQEIYKLTTQSAQERTLYAQWIPEILTGTVDIIGEEKVGSILSVSVSHSNNTGTLYYQWQRDGEDIVNETGKDYVLTENDVDKKIKCIVTSSVQRNSISNTTDAISDEFTVEYDLINITSDGQSIAKIGKEYSTTFLPVEGYKLPENISVKVDGYEISSNKYSYNSFNCSLVIPANEITGNVEIIATALKIPEYTVTVNQVEGVTISPNGVISGILEGSNLGIEIKANSGYKIKLVTVNNIEQTLVENILTINDIKENINVVVEVEKELIEDNIDNVEGTTDSTKDNKNTPQTGDNILLYLGILVISVLGIMTTTKFRKIIKNR